MVSSVIICCFLSLLVANYQVVMVYVCVCFDEKQKKLISDKIPINKRVMNYE